MLAYAGKGRFVLQPVDLSDVIRETGALIRGSISKKISVDLQLGAVPPVESDPSQMQQVLMNLVLNAAEAIGGSAGVISIATGQADVNAASARSLEGWTIEPGRYVFLEVRDTGCGMDAATKSRIFDPFFTTKFLGRGLGLAATAGIVRAQHGAIEVTTAPGAGSTFRVLFPAMPAGVAAPPPAPRKEEHLKGAGTVLIVDDEEVVREAARCCLERQGYEVLVAGSGPAAVDALRRNRSRIRLVILDSSMPGMDGEETLPHLREIEPDLPVLLSSGHSKAEALKPFQGLSVSGFVQKPYRMDQLARAVKSVLART
jgi:CheY-like chemotaxis protein